MKEGLRPAKPGLTFIWHHPYRMPWMLTVFMGLSVLLHAISFYAFQVVYPTATTLRIPAAQLTIVDLADPAYFHLRNWVSAENPSHIMSTLQTPQAEARSLGQVEHRPSFAATSPQLITPSFSAPGELPVPRNLFKGLAAPKRSMSSKPALAMDLPPVRLLASGSLDLALPENIELPADAPADPLDAMAFLVSIKAVGTVGSALLVKSSGSDLIDRFVEQLVEEAEVLNPQEVAGTSAIVYLISYPSAGRRATETGP